MAWKRIVMGLVVTLVWTSGAVEAQKGVRGPRASRVPPKKAEARGARNHAASPPGRAGALHRQPAAKGRAVHDLELLAKKTEYRVPDRLTEAQRNEGFHLNRIETKLQGSSHFNGWWDVVHKNTELVIVQGSAYKGKSVVVGTERYDNAAIIYKQHEAGYGKTTHLDVMGKAGEEVRVIYWRVNENATFDVHGNDVKVNITWPYQAPSGDLHWRDVKLTIQPTKSDRAEPTNTHFTYYQPDSYHGEGPEKGYNQLGGDATDELAKDKIVTPM